MTKVRTWLSHKPHETASQVLAKNFEMIEVIPVSDILPALRALDRIAEYEGDYAQVIAEEALEPFRHLLKDENA